ELHLVVPARNLFPHGFVRVEGFAALVDVPDLHRVSDLQRARIWLLLPRDHPEQRGLAGAVRPDHADDAAARQREIEVVDEQVVAVALAKLPRLHDDVAEPRSWRDVDFRRLDLLRRFLPKQILIRIQTRFALGLAGARRHADPFELAFEGTLPL